MFNNFKEYNAILAKARARERNPVKLKELQTLVFGNYHHIIPRSCERYYIKLKLQFLGGKVGELVWLTYREHERIHVLLIDIVPEELRSKMQRALQWFYDKNGVVFSDKEKKKHRDEGSAALTYSNKKNLGRKMPEVSEAQKGDKHPSKQLKCKGKTQVGILYDKYGNCLLIIVSVDVERRIFGGLSNNPDRKRWGKEELGGAVAKYCYWFKYLDYHTIKKYKTRGEAINARTKLEKKLKPKYKGQFNTDQALTYRAQCKYEKLSSDEKHLIQTGGYNGKEVDHKRSKKSISEGFSSRVAL